MGTIFQETWYFLNVTDEALSFSKSECINVVVPKWQCVSLTTGDFVCSDRISHWLPGDPKPLVTSQFPQKLSIQITLHQTIQKRK